MTETMIVVLEGIGFKRWTKGGYDRLYTRSTLLGLHLEFYGTGNIRRAYLNGEIISNSRARALKEGKNYIDIKDGSVHECCPEIEHNIKALLAELSKAQELWIEQERNALLKQQPRWVPVTERMPEPPKEEV